MADPREYMSGQDALVAAFDEATNSFKQSEVSQMVYSDSSFQATVTSANATSATAVKAKTASKKIYVTDLIISVDTAMNVQLQDDNGSPAVLVEQMYMPANSVFSKTFRTPLVVATNQDLDVITSASGNISVFVSGYVI